MVSLASIACGAAFVNGSATGRKEITSFFYLFMLLTFLSLCLDSGVIPIGTTAYAYFVAVQCGLVGAVCTSLLVNGFIGYQVYEDGTKLSLWTLWGSCILMFFLNGFVAICTFLEVAGLSPTKTTALFVLLYVINGLFLAIYVCAQLFLVLGTLEDRWPIGDIAFGVIFFVAGQVMLYAFSRKICIEIKHYLDGMFFASICNLLGVMMVYKVRKLDSDLRYKANKVAVLGFHHPRGSRVQRRNQGQRLGSQGAHPRGRQAHHSLRRKRERVRRKRVSQQLKSFEHRLRLLLRSSLSCSYDKWRCCTYEKDSDFLVAQ